MVTIFSVVLVEFAGRKFLLAISSAGMFLGSLLLSTYFYLTRPTLCSNSTLLDAASELAEGCNPHLNPLAITAVVLFVISFALGLGPVPWVLLSEYLPLSVRGVAGGIVVASAWSTAAVVAGSFLNLSEAVGAWSLWWIQTCVNLVGFLVIVMFFKETKGRKLEDIQEMFATNPCQLPCSSHCKKS